MFHKVMNCFLVNGTTNCANHPTDPVCDINNNEYANPCLLAHHNAKFAYRGPCLSNCRRSGSVCGINGRTYISECAAWADFSAVDYEGACIAVGLISDSKGKDTIIRIFSILDSNVCLTEEDCS